MERLIASAKRLGLYLTSEQVDKFQTYYQEMVNWNERINLTSIVDYTEVQIKHFLDSLTVTLVVRDMAQERPGLTTLDVGTGAGICEGDEAVIFGRQGTSFLSVWELAATAGTTPYELLCNISERVPRVYTEPDISPKQPEQLVKERSKEKTGMYL